MSSLSQRIKDARKYAKLTQLELSEKIGASLRAYKTYEKDASKITVIMVQKIALSCGINEIWLFTGQGSMIEDVKIEKIAASDDINNIIELEHKDLVSKFKNKAKGKLYNEQLIELEQINEVLFDDIGTYISATLNSAKVMAKSSGKQEGRAVGKKVRKKA